MNLKQLLTRKSVLLGGTALVLVIAIGVSWWALGRMTTGSNSANGSGSSSTKTASKPTVAVIEITPSGFVPNTLSVNPNTDIVWVNEDVMPHLPAADPYPSHSSLPSLVAPKALGQKETYTFLVTKAGTIQYHDDLNPTLVGEIGVR